MKSIELVEVDLESVLVHLESSLMRIRSRFTGFLESFGWFLAILGVKMRTKADFFSLESIELVELDLELVLESSWMLKRRIRLGFTGFLESFGWFLAILGVNMRTKADFFFIGIDRARRA